MNIKPHWPLPSIGEILYMRHATTFLQSEPPVFTGGRLHCNATITVQYWMSSVMTSKSYDDYIAVLSTSVKWALWSNLCPLTSYYVLPWYSFSHWNHSEGRALLRWTKSHISVFNVPEQWTDILQKSKAQLRTTQAHSVPQTQFPFPSLARYTEMHLKGNIHTPYLQNRFQYPYHATIDPPIAHVCQAIVKKFGSCREFLVLLV